MVMQGSCGCKNITVLWRNVDYSLVPRQCQCEHCAVMDAAYVSKSGTFFSVKIIRESLHRINRHGTRQAEFHECANCNQLVFVTVNISDQVYGALNVNCLGNAGRFPAPIAVEFREQSADSRRERWAQNWCYFVNMAAL